MDEDGATSRSPRELFALKCISLSVAALSLLSTTFAFCWFASMRRSFRHDLIILLIQSDFVKALWLLLFPVIELAHGDRVASASPFCQISGFFLAVGVEGCDAAVLLVALHTAAFIFVSRRRSSGSGGFGGGGGLYPYRRAVYVVYAGFPLLAASLAFVGGAPAGYENVGQACYLPVGGTWHRRTYLSWVPRYVVFVAVLALNASMYVYVRVLIGRYSRRSSSVHSGGTPGCELAVPALDYHGLIEGTPESSRRPTPAGRASKDRETSASSMPSPSRGLGGDHQPASGATAPPSNCPDNSLNEKPWGWKGFASPPSPREGSSPDLDEVSPGTHAPRQPALAHNKPATLRRVSFPEPQRRQSGEDLETNTLHSHPRSISSPAITGPSGRVAAIIRSPSLLNLITILRRGPEYYRARGWGSGSGSDASTNGNDASPHEEEGDGLDEPSSLARSRERTRRQLRLLFVYPAAYFAMWALPFVSHMRGYDDPARPGAPFWMLALSTASLCAQGAVDAALFLSQEKPWRHCRAGSWAGDEHVGAGLRVGVRMPDRLLLWRRGRTTTVGGRTGEEMREGGRLARMRRDEEEAEERVRRMERERAEAGQQSFQGGAPARKGSAGRKGGADWWDVSFEGLQGEGEEELS